MRSKISKSPSFTRIRKRTFVVTALVILSILLTGVLISLSAAWLIGPEDLITFNIAESQSRTAVLGSGISVSQAETPNLLQDASFEPLVFRKPLIVYSGDTTTLTVSSEDASSGQYGDGFFDGASARVMSRDEDGLFLKKIAKVVHYGINRVGVFQQVNLPGDTPPGLAILAFARSGEVSLAVGQRGLIINNVAGQTPEIIESGLTADLTGLCITSDGYLACSSQGDLITSANGLTWLNTASFAPAALRAIAASTAGLYVAVGDQGALIAGQGGSGTVLQPLTNSDLTDIACDGTNFVAIGKNGTILTSATGLLWRKVILPQNIDWRAIDYRDGRFVMVGDNSSIAISNNGSDFTLLDHSADQDYIDIVMLTRQQLIVLDREGGFAVSNDSGVTWLNSTIQTGLRSRVIALAGKDKILSADAAGQLGLAQLVAEIQLDSALKEGQYQSGDLIFLEKSSVTVPDSFLTAAADQTVYQDPWQHYGAGSSLRQIDSGSPGGGEASLLLQAGSGSGQQTSIISQIINPASISSDSQNNIYQIDLWMKQSDVADRSVQVWLSGPFMDVGTTLTNVGTTWKKYSYSFLSPLNSSNLTSGEIRLNIAVKSGEVWLDQIRLGLASDPADQLSEEFQKEMTEIAPQLIRMEFLKIGSQNSRQESWAYALGNETSSLTAAGWTAHNGGSLNAALQLADQSGADPWLVVDSYASEAELLNMIEYIAGPISERYGKLRMDQGAVIPWTGRFGRILIEFTDTEGTFQTDQLKADFVNLMIQTVSQSPYYRQIKSQLVFVDGMIYDAGVVLSTADYHASDLSGFVQADHAAAIQGALTAYYDLIPRNPEKQSQAWSELMRTARLGANGIKLPTLADLTEILLRDLGQQTILSNLDLPARNSQDWSPAWPSAAKIAAACARGVSLDITTESTDVLAHGFESNDQIAIALTNFSDNTAICSMITDLPLQDARLYQYDSKGQLITRQTLRSPDSRINVLAGGVVLIVKDLAGVS